MSTFTVLRGRDGPPVELRDRLVQLRQKVERRKAEWRLKYGLEGWMLYATGPIPGRPIREEERAEADAICMLDEELDSIEAAVFGRRCGLELAKEEP